MTVSLMSALRPELRRVVVGLARYAVLVRLAVDDRLGDEVAVSGRGRSSPLQRGGVPGVLRHPGALLQAEEEVHDEEELCEPQAPGAPGDEHVQRLDPAAVRVHGRVVE